MKIIKTVYLILFLIGIKGQGLSQQIPEAIGGFSWPLEGTYLGDSLCNGVGEICTNEGLTFLESHDYKYPIDNCDSIQHPGIDLNMPGTYGGCNSGCSTDECLPVVAAAIGKVIFVNNDQNSWAGVVIEHNYSGETWYTQYGHVRDIIVNLGDVVTKGQRIASIGSRATSCGHLHFEVRENDHPIPSDGTYWEENGNCYLEDSVNVEDWYEDPSIFIPSHPTYSVSLNSPQNNQSFSTSAVINWDGISGATDYRVQISDNPLLFSYQNGFTQGQSINQNVLVNQTVGTATNLNVALPKGTYYVTVRAATDYEVSPYCYYRKFTITDGTTHDFYISHQSISENIISPGSVIEVECRQYHSGTNDIRLYPEVGYFLSTDTEFDQSDYFLDADQSSIDNGDVYDIETENILISSSYGSGTFYLLFVADWSNYYPYETNEGNQVKYQQLIIEPQNIDITISNPTLYNTIFSPGQTVKVKCRQNFSGNSSQTVYPTVGYFYSNDPYLSSSDQLLGTDVSSLSSNDLFDYETEYVTIPANALPGTRYLLFVADYFDDANETNENNQVVHKAISVPYTLDSPPINNTLGLHESTFEVNLFPNPVKDDLNLVFLNKIPNNEIVIKLVDIDGNHVLRKSLYLDLGKSNQVLDLKEINSGTYFLQVQGEDYTETIKIIVAN